MTYTLLPGHSLSQTPQHRIVRAFPDTTNGGAIYPVIWSRSQDGGKGYVCIFLISRTGQTGVSYLEKSQYDLLPFCEVEW